MNGCEQMKCEDYRNGQCHYGGDTCKHRNNDNEVQELQNELQSLRTLIWAAIRSNDGELIIKDSFIVMCPNDAELHRYNDSENKQLILTAT